MSTSFSAPYFQPWKLGSPPECFFAASKGMSAWKKLSIENRGVNLQNSEIGVLPSGQSCPCPGHAHTDGVSGTLFSVSVLDLGRHGLALLWKSRKHIIAAPSVSLGAGLCWHTL